MNYGEMKTTFFAKLPEQKREMVSVFEFGEAIDAAQRLFAIVLPKEVIPELLIEKFIDRGTDEGATNLFPLPEDYLRLEKVQFAQARDANDIPIREDARIVDPEEYEELVQSGSLEQIATVFNNLLHVSPTPAAPVTDKPAALKMIYRKLPRPYTTTAGVLQHAARMHLRQDVENRHMFRLYEHSGTTRKPFSYWDLDANELPGGYAYIGAPWMTADTKGPLYVCRIVMAYEEFVDPDYFGVIRVSSDDSIPYEDESPGVGYLFPYCYIAQRQAFGDSTSAVEAEDWDFPDMRASWHHMIIDYAVARVEVQWDPKASVAREGKVLQALAAAGAKLDYRKDDTQ